MWNTFDRKERKELWNLVFRAVRIMLFPPTRRRLRFSLNFYKLIARFLLDFMRGPKKTFGDSMEQTANMLEDASVDISETDDFTEVRQLLADIETFKSTFRENLIPSFYTFETESWIQAVLNKENQQGTYTRIRERITNALDGHTKPLFTPFTIPQPDAETVKNLKLGDAISVIAQIELIPFEHVISLIPDESALIYLIVTDDGTFGIILQKDTPFEIFLCASFTRKKVENLLRGWMWLYYWHSNNMYDKAVDHMVGRQKKMSKKMSQEEEASWKEAYLKIPYELLFHNQMLFNYLQPTEIPTNDGIPAIPFPSWLLMEAILRELGRGDLVSNEGLWQRIDEKLHSRKVKRVILCPDKALALFPHHGAILNIGRDGKKECVLDRYEIVYLPQGALAQMTRPNLQTPRLLIFGTSGEELSSLGTMSLRDLAPDCIKEWYSQDGREKFAAEISKVNALTFLGHGKYDWEEPSLSFLGLCMDHGGTGFNDLITLENLVKLIPSHLNLIVLAGCETGLPRITTKATDYKGFAEDLLSRCSASTIVSTLWPVPKVSTVLLMRQFHKYWLLGNEILIEKPLPPATALRKAQLWLRALARAQCITELEALASIKPSEAIAKEIQALNESIVERPYAHPYFWSAYYVMGGIS